MLAVLVIITRGEPGGAQVHVLDLVSGLRDRIAFQVAVGDDSFLAAELRARGVPVHVVHDMRRDVSPFADQRALLAIRSLVSRVRPTLVHTHSSKAGVLGRLAAAAEGIPAIHTAHGWAFAEGTALRRKALAIPFEAAVSRWTNRYIVVSEKDRDLAVRYAVARPSQVRVVRNGVTDAPERARPDAPGTPVVTMVARMAAPKEHLLLLRALSRIDLPFFVTLVGDGPDRESIAQAAERLGLGQRVAFAGVRRDIPALLAASHVFALVSRYEGFPLAVLEAMRAGLPVVASDVGGIREAVTPGRTGLLVRRGDEADLRDALARLLASPSLRARLGAAGRQAYEERFTVRHMLAGTHDVYRETAASVLA